VNKMKAFLAVVLVLGLSVLGCGPSGPKTYPVKGKVTIGGQPANNVTINFGPTGAGGSVASGVVTNGQYELLTGNSSAKGAMVGKYRVYFSQAADASSAMPDYSKMGADGGPPGTTPAPYAAEYGDANNSPLEKEVVAGPNTFDFDIPAPAAK
jgi:hypothetical protein